MNLSSGHTYQVRCAWLEPKFSCQHQGKLSLAKKKKVLLPSANITRLAYQMFGQKKKSYLLNR